MTLTFAYIGRIKVMSTLRHFAIEYPGNSSKDHQLIGNGLWGMEWSRDRWHHVTLKGKVVIPNPNTFKANYIQTVLCWWALVNWPSVRRRTSRFRQWAARRRWQTWTRRTENIHATGECAMAVWTECIWKEIYSEILFLKRTSLRLRTDSMKPNLQPPRPSAIPSLSSSHLRHPR